MGKKDKFIDDVKSLGNKKSKFREHWIKCSIASTTALILDYLILIFLVENLNIFYLTASVLSFAIAHTGEYYINRNYIFYTKKFDVARYFRFIFFGFISILILIFLMKILVEGFGIHYLFSRLVVAAVVGFFLFVVNYIFTFKMLHPEHKRE